MLGDARRNKHESPKAEAGGKKTSMEWLHGVLQVYLTEHINQMFSLQSIHPQARQINSAIPCHEIKLMGSWVN